MYEKRSQSKGVTLLLIFVLACTLPGCMTLLNNSSIGHKGCNQVYLGTRLFVSGLGQLSNPGVFPLILIFLIDLPFSFTADTLLLPYTIPSSIQQCREEKNLKEIEERVRKKWERYEQEEKAWRGLKSNELP